MIYFTPQEQHIRKAEMETYRMMASAHEFRSPNYVKFICANCGWDLPDFGDVYTVNYWDGNDQKMAFEIRRVE